MRDEIIAAPKFLTIGRSDARDEATSVREAIAEFDLPRTCFILTFVPSHLDLQRTIAALNQLGCGVPIFGCTTAGQISDRGYDADALVLLAFPKAHFRCASVLIDQLHPFSPTGIAAKVQRCDDTFSHTAGWNRLGLILTDGMSKQEDLLISTLQTVLDGFPIYGGSAGDGLEFKTTSVIHGGEDHSNAALLLLLETNLPFQGIGFDHFLPSDRLLVITQADPEERLVHEINGAAAATEYARLVGCSVEELSPRIFAENPLLLMHESRHYVRAISDVTEDGALRFLAAIDEGLVMTLGQGKAIVETLEAGLCVRDLSAIDPDFILGFDCVLRKLEIAQNSLHDTVSEILRRHRVFGFNTYGEQQSGLHMNQTFVGVAFFHPEPEIVL